MNRVSGRWLWLLLGTLILGVWLVFLAVKRPTSSVEAIRVLAPNMEKVHVLKYGGERPPRLNWRFEGLAQSDCLETIDNIGVGFGERLSWASVECRDGSMTKFARPAFLSPSHREKPLDRVEVVRAYLDMAQLRPLLQRALGPQLEEAMEQAFKEDCNSGETIRKHRLQHGKDSKKYPDPGSLMGETCYSIKETESALHKFWSWVENIDIKGFRLYVGDPRQLVSRTYSEGIGVSIDFRATGNYLEVDCPLRCTLGAANKRKDYGRTGWLRVEGTANAELGVQAKGNLFEITVNDVKADIVDLTFEGTYLNTVQRATFSMLSSKVEDSIKSSVQSRAPAVLNSRIVKLIEELEDTLVGEEFREWLFNYGVPERLRRLAASAQFKLQRTDQKGSGEKLYASLSVGRAWLGNETPQLKHTGDGRTFALTISYAFVNRLLDSFMDRPLAKVMEEVDAFAKSARVGKAEASKLAGLAVRLQGEDWCPLGNFVELSALIGLECGSPMEFSVPLRLRPDSPKAISVFASDVQNMFRPTGGDSVTMSTSFEGSFRLDQRAHENTALKVAFEAMTMDAGIGGRVVGDRYRAVAALLNELLSRGPERWRGLLTKTPDLTSLIDQHEVWSSLRGLDEGFTFKFPEQGINKILAGSVVDFEHFRNVPEQYALVIDGDLRF